jgi:hypothetical protein
MGSKTRPKRTKPATDDGHVHRGGFCWNCGQTARGATFVAALTQTAAFCCRCGKRLAPDGTCTRTKCPFFGRRPSC